MEGRQVLYMRRCKPQIDIYQVVDGESGIINDMRERWDTIGADHMKMAKFSDRMDDGYGKMLYAFVQLLNRSPDVEWPPGHGMEQSDEFVASLIYFCNRDTRSSTLRWSSVGIQNVDYYQQHWDYQLWAICV